MSDALAIVDEVLDLVDVRAFAIGDTPTYIHTLDVAPIKEYVDLLREFHEDPSECPDCRPVTSTRAREPLTAGRLAAAINDAQVQASELRLGHDLLPVAERILARLGDVR